VRIAIVEDQEIMADALAILCVGVRGSRVVAQARTGKEAIKAILSSNPDLVILDLGLPDADGFHVMDVVRRAGCNPRVLVLSAYCDNNTVYRVERAGFDGFVDKGSEALRSLREALRAVSKGQRYFSEGYMRVRSRRRRDPQSFDRLLTERQQTVLSLIGGLFTDEEIASRLRVSRNTAEKHRFNILKKLGLRSKVTLLRYANIHGFRPLTGLIGENDPAGKKLS
jgi:DNA-binding NarL/FixJ family response regulator